MIKTEYIDSSNYEVLSFSLRLLTSIYKTNKNINGIYINYLYRDSLSVVRMILISDKSLSQEELSRFDIMIDSLYKSIGIKIEIYYDSFLPTGGCNPPQSDLFGTGLCIGVSLVLGIVLSCAYSYKTRHNGSFVRTLAILPAANPGTTVNEDINPASMEQYHALSESVADEILEKNRLYMQ